MIKLQNTMITFSAKFALPPKLAKEHKTIVLIKTCLVRALSAHMFSILRALGC